jgi:tetratricopeptide (TPR) repeat protein
MQDTGNKMNAQQVFERGSTLLQQQKYEEALVELRQAEQLFRKIDVKGHPFMSPLSNGVSGLANALAQSGLCYLNLGDFRKAAQCFESCFINSKFEKIWPFRTFLRTVNENLITCYGTLLRTKQPDYLGEILKSDPAIDTAYEFPFSLSEYAVMLARLFELSPDRYPDYRQFYLRARAKDREIRKREKKSDEASMRRLIQERSAMVSGVLRKAAAFSPRGLRIVSREQNHGEGLRQELSAERFAEALR